MIERRAHLRGRNFNNRWTVCPSKFSKCALMFGDKSNPSKARCKARAICAAALPVGAANAIRGSFVLLLQIRPKSFATVVVLPVPGPPVISIKFCSKAKAAASLCSLLSLGSNQSLRLFEATMKFTSSASALASRLISTAKSCSNCHIRPKNNFRPCRISGLSALPTKFGKLLKASTSALSK